MNARSLALLALSTTVAIACGDDGKTSGDTSTTTTTTAPDTSSGDVAPDTNVDDTNVDDTTVADTNADATNADDTSVDTTQADTSEPSDSSDDTKEPSTVQAVKGARCALADRVGLIEIDGSFGSLNVNGKVFDRPSPFYGDPALSDASCSFYEFVPAAPCPATCAEDEVCGISGACSKAQLPLTDARLVLTDDSAASQTLTADAQTGDIYGSPTLSGRTLAVQLSFGGQVVESEPITIPADLGDTSGVLEGGYEAPTHLTINWTAPSAIIGVPRVDSSVFTHIPINHHAGGPTFTECQVGAGLGVMDVDGSMLAPLAVITGLEFQGIEHVRFAAADTAEGCVEIRWLIQEYPSLTESTSE